MQTYRLRIGSDGKVKIPDGEPGSVVTVTLEAGHERRPAVEESPLAAMTAEQRERLKQEFLERGRRVRERLKDDLPIDHGAEIYGEDGLP